MGNQLRPYYDADGKPVMEQSVVLVADIIGFKARMWAALSNGTEQEELVWLSEKLQYARSIIADPSGYKWSMKVYSDNLIVGYPSRVGSSIQFEFSMACWHMVHLQLQLARDGLFIRGGIAVGNIHIGDDLIFGHPLNELSNSEEKAKSPRVILLQSAVEYVKARPDIEAESLYANSVLVDVDSVRYINYLYPLYARHSAENAELLLQHKGLIRTNLDRHWPCHKVFRKYLWAAKYHNRSCKQSRFYNHPEFIIDI